MVENLGDGWIGFSPHDEIVAPEIRQRGLDEAKRKPVAKVVFELLSDKAGDLRAGFEVHPEGPFGGEERTPEERRAAFLKISELIEAEVDRWIHLYRGDGTT
jgi:hypothetical protein